MVFEILPPDGGRFLSYVEVAQRAEDESQRANLAEEKARRLAKRLREMRIEPDQV